MANVIYSAVSWLFAGSVGGSIGTCFNVILRIACSNVSTRASDRCKLFTQRSLTTHNEYVTCIDIKFRNLSDRGIESRTTAITLCNKYL